MMGSITLEPEKRPAVQFICTLGPSSVTSKSSEKLACVTPKYLASAIVDKIGLLEVVSTPITFPGACSPTVVTAFGRKAGVKSRVSSGTSGKSMSYNTTVADRIVVPLHGATSVE